MTVGFNQGNFVKFVRGTSTLWNSLTQRNSDTLYFITNPGNNNGALYLGNTLIAGNLDTIEDTLGGLADVKFNTLNNNEVLMYNEETQKWENQPLTTAINGVIKVMQGATSTENGLSGLVPAPVSGQQSLFLQGDGSWANPTAAVELTLKTLIGKDAQKSIREIATDVSTNAVNKVLDGAPEAFDTLKEVSDWIDTHPEMSEINTLITGVDSIEDTLNGVEDTPGLISRVGTLEKATGNLNTLLNGDGKTNPGLISVVSNLEKVTNHHTEEINEINETLRWQSLTE